MKSLLVLFFLFLSFTAFSQGILDDGGDSNIWVCKEIPRNQCECFIDDNATSYRAYEKEVKLVIRKIGDNCRNVEVELNHRALQTQV